MIQLCGLPIAADPHRIGRNGQSPLHHGSHRHFAQIEHKPITETTKSELRTPR
jgi:hypothetical protein